MRNILKTELHFKTFLPLFMYCLHIICLIYLWIMLADFFLPNSYKFFRYKVGRGGRFAGMQAGLNFIFDSACFTIISFLAIVTSLSSNYKIHVRVSIALFLPLIPLWILFFFELI